MLRLLALLLLVLPASAESASVKKFGKTSRTVYEVDSQESAEAALVDCGVGVGGGEAKINGCTIRFACGVIPVTTLALSGSTLATGRDGLIVEGCSAGGSINASGDAVGGTVLTSSTAASMMTVGICHGCIIRNLGFDGNDTATTAIDLLDASDGWPSGFVKIQNNDIDDINGYAIRTANTGQWDNLLITGNSIRGSDGCYQQRDNQNKIMMWDNNECAALTGDAPNIAFDIPLGTFDYSRSFFGSSSEATTVFEFGIDESAECVALDDPFDCCTGAGVGSCGNDTEYSIRDSRFELDGPDQKWIVDGHDGDQGGIAPRVVDHNYVKQGAPSIVGTCVAVDDPYDCCTGEDLGTCQTVCLDIFHRGSFTYSNNAVTDLGAADSSDDCTADFAIDHPASASQGAKLRLISFGNVQRNLIASQFPENWAPTVTGDVDWIHQDARKFVASPAGTVTLQASDAMMGQFHSNVGAVAASRIVLPAAKVGDEFTVVIGAAQMFTVVPASGDQFVAFGGISPSASEGIEANGVGEYAHFMCQTAGLWTVLDFTGGSVWAEETP